MFDLGLKVPGVVFQQGCRGWRSLATRCLLGLYLQHADNKPSHIVIIMIISCPFLMLPSILYIYIYVKININIHIYIYIHTHISMYI